MWIFGYGSLVWRPDFPHETRRPAVIRGWARRFWQGSTDHRGVPGDPGRVVTLVEKPAGEVWGCAFALPAAQEEEILARLDHREKGGYERVTVPLRDPGGAPFAEGLVYRATPDNPNWLGPAPLEALLAQIRHASGPSGPNVEYVVELAEALARMGAEDPHVFTLARGLGWRGPGG